MFLPSGQVRFVSKVIEIWRSASIHNEVPVNPRWPKDPAKKYFPASEVWLGVSSRACESSPRNEFPFRENGEAFLTEHRCAAIQQGLREAGQVLGGREEPCVPGDPAHSGSVIVIHLALNHSRAESLVVEGWGNGRALFG